MNEKNSPKVIGVDLATGDDFTGYPSIPVRYRKKSKGTETKKSKHKHEYVNGFHEFIYRHPVTQEKIIRIEHIRYCSICGKTGEAITLFTEKDNEKYDLRSGSKIFRAAKEDDYFCKEVDLEDYYIYGK